MLLTATCRGTETAQKGHGDGRRRRILSGSGGRPDAEKRVRGRRPAPERCDDDAADGENGTTGYHPVRRRSPSSSPPPPPLPPPSTEPVATRWFGNCWRPKSPSVNATGDHHHHCLRVYRHRHHHHTHHLHMWTNSYCWWLLVLYAAVVVVASFARAAHSAKDGKYSTRFSIYVFCKLSCGGVYGSDF